jgi:hypothetical protein
MNTQITESATTRVEYFVYAEHFGMTGDQSDRIGPFCSAVDAFKCLTSQSAYEGRDLSIVRRPGLGPQFAASPPNPGEETVAWYGWRVEPENSPWNRWQGVGFRFATEFIDELTSELNRTEGGQDVFFTSTDRRVLLDLLTCEFQALLCRDRGSKESIENLLNNLDSARTSAGLTCDVYRMYEPEQMVSESGIEYSQSFEVIFRYEDVELGSWSLESKGRFEAGEWRGEPAEWPEVLKGLAPLPHVMIKIPDLDLYVTADPAARKQGVQRREREFSRELERGLQLSEQSKQTLRDQVYQNRGRDHPGPER